MRLTLAALEGVCQSVNPNRETRGKEANSRLVDDHHHAALAVLALGAVQPQRGAGVDLDGVGREHALRGARGGGEEARVEAREVAVLGDGLARLVEGRLRDRVVARVELELDELAGLRDQLVGRVGQTAVLGDGDDPGFLGWWRVNIPLSVSAPLVSPGDTYQRPGSRERRGRVL